MVPTDEDRVVLLRRLIIETEETIATNIEAYGNREQDDVVLARMKVTSDERARSGWTGLWSVEGWLNR